MGQQVKAEVQWTDGERFIGVASSGHAMVVDSDRARNSGVGPMELVLIGLCSCTASDVVNILRKKRLTFSDLRVRADAERASQPPTVYKHIKLIYSIDKTVSHKAMEDAVRLSKEKYCSVSQMLQKTTEITSEIEYL